MGSQRFVYLDPDGMDDGWLYVVVEAPTGVLYQQQYGGAACLQGRIEGFLVPVFGPDALEAFRRLFVEELRGAGTWKHTLSEDERARLRDIVAGITYWACDGHDEEPHELRLDEGRIGDADEAWLPVTTPDGPGVLLWFNSD